MTKDIQLTQFKRDLYTNVKTLKAVLPESITPEKFSGSVATAISMSTDRDKILRANRESLINSCISAAKDGLLCDNREAALVVFKNQVTYMPMAKGLVKLALRHPDVVKVDSYVVYECDEFQYIPDRDPQPYFNPDWKVPPSKRGEPTLAYAVVTLKNGEKIVRILHAERIMAIAADTRNSSQYNPKSKHFEEWWKKTAIRAVLKFAPSSTEADRVINHDNQFYDDQQSGDEMKSVNDINDELNSIDLEEQPQDQEDVIVDAEYSEEQQPQQNNGQVF